MTSTELCAAIPKEGKCVYDDEAKWLYDTASAMETVVEIGSYKGRSTAMLCTTCRGNVIVVEPFIPSRAYPEFCINMAPFSNYTLMPTTSVLAAETIHDKSIDMVFIDGSLEYRYIIQDLKAWFPKANRLICGRGYGDPDSGMSKAVDEFFAGKAELPVNTIWSVKI